MKTIILIVLIATVILAKGTGCNLLGDSPVDLIREVPEPDTVDVQALPAPSERVYHFFLPPSGEKFEAARHGPEPLLKELLRNHLDVEKAWYPNRLFICMNAAAAYALVVQLKEPDARILDFGYTAEHPDWWIINCGSGTFRQYTFAD